MRLVLILGLVANAVQALPWSLIPQTDQQAGFAARRKNFKLKAENEELRQRITELEQQQRRQRQEQQTLQQHAGVQHLPVNVTTAFTSARLREVAGPARQLILTFVNHARIDFARTWAAHVRRLELRNWLIGATDHEALRLLVESRTPCVNLHTSLPDGEWGWGSPSFHQLGPTKVRLIKLALDAGLELIITDVDALVLREPFHYMSRWPDAGFLTTSDHLRNTTSDDGLETHEAQSAYNIGYMLFRPAALPLVDEWLRTVTADPTGTWDQGVFNQLARLGATFGEPDDVDGGTSGPSSAGASATGSGPAASTSCAGDSTEACGVSVSATGASGAAATATGS